MSATIAWRMMSADFLKLRKRIGNVSVALLLACGPLIAFFIVKAAQHASDPAAHGPAGGISGYTDALRVFALFFGQFAAVVIGVDAGAGDNAVGVFRDLVATGRSRLALFATRLPAAIALTWIVALCGYALLLIGTFAFAGGTPTPDGALVANGLGLTLLSTGVLCAVAVGLSALTASRVAGLSILIGWQLVASPILENVDSLGSSRRGLLSEGISHFSPVHVGDHSGSVQMPIGTALIVMAVWVGIFVALGAWRTARMDA